MSSGENILDLDGVTGAKLNELIRKRAGVTGSHSGIRPAVRKLGILNGITIDGKFPWLPMSLRREHPDAIEKMSGLSHILRASPIFHGRPIYDHALAVVDGKPHFVQVRLIFQVPPSAYADLLETFDGALLLVRVLERGADMRQLSKLADTEDLEKHATPLQLSSDKEGSDRTASEKMRDWLAAEVTSAQRELRDSADEISIKEIEINLREKVKWAENVERSLLEPVMMHEFGLDRLAYKLKADPEPIPKDENFRVWAVLPAETSKMTRAQPRRQEENGQSSRREVRGQTRAAGFRADGGKGALAPCIHAVSRCHRRRRRCARRQNPARLWPSRRDSGEWCHKQKGHC